MNSGGTSFLLKVGSLFLILTMTVEEKLKTSELITRSGLFRFVPKIDIGIRFGLNKTAGLFKELLG